MNLMNGSTMTTWSRSDTEASASSHSHAQTYCSAPTTIKRQQLVQILQVTGTSWEMPSFSHKYVASRPDHAVEVRSPMLPTTCQRTQHPSAGLTVACSIAYHSASQPHRYTPAVMPFVDLICTWQLTLHGCRPTPCAQDDQWYSLLVLGSAIAATVCPCIASVHR